MIGQDAPQNKTVLEEALRLHRAGLCVIPVVRGDKKPVVKWSVFQRTRPDETTIYRWFGTGDSDLAVVCGKVSGGLMVADHDNKKSYYAWAAAHPELAATCPTVETGRGYHVYARADYALRAGKIGLKVRMPWGDLQADGRYVVAPPSTHKSGRQYRWLIPLAYALPAVPLADLLPPSAEDDTQTCHVCHSSSGSGLTMTEAIARTLPTGVGQRNACLWRLARLLRGRSGLASADACRSVVRQWFEQALPVIGTKDWETTWADFQRQWAAVRSFGGGSLQAAVMAAKASDPPAAALRYQGQRMRLLVTLCAELQRLNGTDPFYLSCRNAALAIGIKSHKTAWRWLRDLILDGVLELTAQGTVGIAGRANEYRYKG